MFTTTLSMWLGLTFLVLAVAAVLLQAWLWGPKFWDEQSKKTRAPRAWLRVHAAVGYSYAAIYLFMMWNMVPRLWTYQYELPARTVVHATVAIVLGVILITKIVILRFFRHFEEAMPRLGFGLLVSTVLLIFLSVPYALRAHDISGRTTDPENLERTRRLLAELDMGEGAPEADELVSHKGLARGRGVLVTNCIQCHDMRTILTKPRTASGWYKVTRRMLEKPAVFGEALRAEDVPWVTGYLVAITPDIQESVKLRTRDEQARQATREQTAQAVHAGDLKDVPELDDAAAQALLQRRCTECHELDEVENHGGSDLAGWRSMIAAMVEEGAEITPEESAQLAVYLAKTYPGTGEDHPDGGEQGSGGPAPEDNAPGTGDTNDGGAAAPHDEAAPAGSGEPAHGQKSPATPADPKAGTHGAKPHKSKGKSKKAPHGKTPAADEPQGGGPATQPAEDTAAPSASRGRALFLKKCKTCHGTDGKGQTSYGRKLKVPDLTTTGLSRNELLKVIRNGRSGTKMRGYASKLSPEQIADLVAFVRGL